MSAEAWVTDDDLKAARERFAADIPGYQAPVAYAVGAIGSDGAAHFPHVNRGVDHLLPAVVIARVCGHVSGTRTYRLSLEDLRTGIDLLAPAEAAIHWDHPNLAAWRALAANDDNKEFVAVFVADLNDPPVDECDEALREALAGS